MNCVGRPEEYPDMISSDYNSTDGKLFHHNTGSKGSKCTIRVGSRSLPLYPVVIGCLALLNTILIVTAVVIGIYCGTVSELPSEDQITAQALLIEAKQLQIIHAEAITAEQEAREMLKKELSRHEQLKMQLGKNKTLSDSLQRQLETLNLERTTLRSDSADIRASCGRCLPGWVLFNSSCYFRSISASNPLKIWSESRDDCISRGANLTIIDSLEEQLNLFEYLPKLDPSIRPWWSRPGGIWIGLTDIHTEGNWVWLNNATVQNKGYWIPGEPNNHGGEENCAAITNMKNPRETWFDASCMEKKEYLCEMEPNSL